MKTLFLAFALVLGFAAPSFAGEFPNIPLQPLSYWVTSRDPLLLTKCGRSR